MKKNKIPLAVTTQLLSVLFIYFSQCETPLFIYVVLTVFRTTRLVNEDVMKTIDLITEYNDFTLKLGMQLAGHLSKQNGESFFLWFSGEREQQSMNHFNLCSISKLEFRSC